MRLHNTNSRFSQLGTESSEADLGMLCSAKQGAPQKLLLAPQAEECQTAHSSRASVALDMFEVLGRTEPQTLVGPQFWAIKIPYKLTCRFERL